MKLSGQCLCGAVGFTIDGWVSPIQACHAKRCRRATGAVFAPEIAAQKEGFSWRGDPSFITSYEAPLLNSPPAYRRNFCKCCGSPLPVEMEGYVIVHAGILDDANALSVFRHAFTAQKLEGVDLTDGLPQFEGQPPAPDPSMLIP